MAPPDWTTTAIMVFTLLLFNVSILKLFQTSLKQVNIRGAMLEKNAVSASHAKIADDGKPADSDQTSFSRIAGGTGAIVLACFLWALGNVVLFKSFTALSEVATLLGGVQTYFLAGASLFAPYAFNQLRSAFRGDGN